MANIFIKVISKIGEVSKEDSARLSGLLVQDAWNDFKKDLGPKFDTLTSQHQKIMPKKLGTASKKVVEEYFKKT